MTPGNAKSLLSSTERSGKEEALRALTAAEIDRIKKVFDDLKGIYGDRFNTTYDRTRNPRARDQWAMALRTVTDPQIAQGIAHCRDMPGQHPPNAKEFKRICINQKYGEAWKDFYDYISGRQRYVTTEAAQAVLDQVLDYHTASLLPHTELKNRFTAAYFSIDMRNLAPVRKPTDVPRIGRVSQRNTETGKRALADIRKQLGLPERNQC